MSNFARSLIRTYVPLLVGALVGWLVSLGIDLSDEAVQGLTVFLSGFFAGLYYLIVRLIEQQFPRLGGILLGGSGEPVYPMSLPSGKPSAE